MATRYVTPFQVRFPEELKTLIDEAASANSRSINAEIIARLESSFSPIEMPTITDQDLLAEFLRRYKTGRIVVEISSKDVEHPASQAEP